MKDLFIYLGLTNHVCNKLINTFKGGKLTFVFRFSTKLKTFYKHYIFLIVEKETFNNHLGSIFFRNLQNLQARKNPSRTSAVKHMIAMM